MILPKPIPVNRVEHRDLKVLQENSYGKERVVLSHSDLAHLFSGKPLLLEVQGGEYTVTLELE